MPPRVPPMRRRRPRRDHRRDQGAVRQELTRDRGRAPRASRSAWPPRSTHRRRHRVTEVSPHGGAVSLCLPQELDDRPPPGLARISSASSTRKPTHGASPNATWSSSSGPYTWSWVPSPRRNQAQSAGVVGDDRQGQDVPVERHGRGEPIHVRDPDAQERELVDRHAAVDVRSCRAAAGPTASASARISAGPVPQQPPSQVAPSPSRSRRSTVRTRRRHRRPTSERRRPSGRRRSGRR